MNPPARKLPIRRKAVLLLAAGIAGALFLAIIAKGRDNDQPAPPAKPYEPTSAPAPKGKRVLGIDVNEAENRDYGQAFAAAKSAGVQSVSLALYWNGLETAPNTYKPEPNFLAIASAFYPPQQVSVNITLRPVDTTGKQLPEDLKSRRLNDPVVIERFKRLTDYVFSQIPKLQTGCLGIGNEIDLGLGDNAEAWRDYTEFYTNVAAYVKHGHPNVRIGATATLDGLTGKHREQLLELNRASDVVLVTYYPINPDFTVRDPSVVSNDFATMVKVYPGKPLFFEEAGYPSSTVNRSSLEKQRQFIHEVFQAWDRYPTQIELVMFTWLTDCTADKVRGFKKFYGLGDARFLEYLRSLGLRTCAGAGADKPAFEALKTEAHLRGW